MKCEDDNEEDLWSRYT